MNDATADMAYDGTILAHKYLAAVRVLLKRFQAPDFEDMADLLTARLKDRDDDAFCSDDETSKRGNTLPARTTAYHHWLAIGHELVSQGLFTVKYRDSVVAVSLKGRQVFGMFQPIMLTTQIRPYVAMLMAHPFDKPQDDALNALRSWMVLAAEDRGNDKQIVLPTILERSLATYLPRTVKDLARIPGVGTSILQASAGILKALAPIKRKDPLGDVDVWDYDDDGYKITDDGNHFYNLFSYLRNYLSEGFTSELFLLEQPGEPFSVIISRDLARNVGLATSGRFNAILSRLPPGHTAVTGKFAMCAVSVEVKVFPRNDWGRSNDFFVGPRVTRLLFDQDEEDSYFTPIVLWPMLGTDDECIRANELLESEIERQTYASDPW